MVVSLIYSSLNDKGSNLKWNGKVNGNFTTEKKNTDAPTM